MSNANDWLMAGGTASAKFPGIGAGVTGDIVREPEIRQQTDIDGKPKFWDDGKPREQMIVTVSTTERDPADPHDNGERSIYVKGNMTAAIREAVRRVGAPGLAVGGRLSVTYVADGEAKGNLNPPKIYTATYQAPAVQAANQFLNGQAAPQPPVYQQAPPAPQYAPAAPAPPVYQQAPQQFAQPAQAYQQAPAPAAPGGLSPEAQAAIAALTPEMRAQLNLPA